MHIGDIISRGKPGLSFEFFPPRTHEARAKLSDCVTLLERFAPDFVSVTYGAAGSTRGFTLELVEQLQRATSLNAIPHLTCLGKTRGEVTEILQRYAAMGVGNLLALRGDRPVSGEWPKGEFAHAAELVAAIRSFSAHPDPRGFGIGVAGFPEGHPETPNRLLEMDHLKAKVDAGADYICTQLFFENADFYDFRERCELAGIRIPIIAGIMPVTTLAGLRKVAALAAGARLPARLLKALYPLEGDDEAMRRTGIAYAHEQCRDLLQQGVAGLHFYTLNQAGPTAEILQNLGSFGEREPID